MNTNKANPDQSNRGQSNRDQSIENAEAGLEHVLRNFRASVHAWSDAELSRPHLVPSARRRGWRFAAAWALSCLIAAGTLTAGLYQHYRTQLLASSSTHQPQIQQEQQDQVHAPQAAVVEPPAGPRDEGLMASVDSDISRPVPSAMEPLAQLMDDNGDQ